MILCNLDFSLTANDLSALASLCPVSSAPARGARVPAGNARARLALGPEARQRLEKPAGDPTKNTHTVGSNNPPHAFMCTPYTMPHATCHARSRTRARSSGDAASRLLCLLVLVPLTCDLRRGLVPLTRDLMAQAASVVGRFYDTALLHAHPSLLCGDSTPSYLLHGPLVIPRLLATMPGRPQLLVCLRDPVARAYSHYQVPVWYTQTRDNQVLAAVTKCQPRACVLKKNNVSRSKIETRRVEKPIYFNVAR